MAWYNDSYGHSIASSLGHYKKKSKQFKNKKERNEYLKGIRKEMKTQIDNTESTWEVNGSHKPNKDTNRALDRALELYGTKYNEEIDSIHTPKKKVKLVCSTLITEMFPDYGYLDNLDDQLNHKNSMKIDDKKELKKGDLIFFKYRKGKDAHHVGIIAGFTGKADCRQIWFLNTSNSHGVILSRTGGYGGPNLGTKKNPKHKPWSTYITGYRRPRRPNK